MKTVLITGISRGIGKALAQKFLTEGYRVIGTSQTGTVDFSHEALQIVKLNLSSPESINICATTISTLLQATNGKIDILINNAGVLADKGETKLIIEKLRRNLDVNTIGTADFTEHCLSCMNNEGHVIFISSAAGSLGDMDHIDHSHAPYKYPGYKISKAALNMYMRTLAARLHHERTSITVSSVHPGWVRTHMGGDDAPITADEAALDIYNLVISHPETGQFWYKKNTYPW